MISVSKLTQDALNLPLEERIRLAQALWESVHSSTDAVIEQQESDVIDEAIRRDTEMETGKVQGIPHDQAMEILRKKFG